MARTRQFIGFVIGFLLGVLSIEFIKMGEIWRVVFIVVGIGVVFRRDFSWSFLLGVFFGIFRAIIGKNYFIGEEEGGDIWFVVKVRDLFNDRISNLFIQPYAGLLKGLILGVKDELSFEIKQDFQYVGLTHIIAVSGYNVTLIILGGNFVFGFLGRRLKVVVLMLLILFFVFLVGFSASTVRAALMGGISLLALYFGRNYLAMISIAFSAFVMVVLSPEILVSDIGFQLSFFATMGIIFVAPRLKKYFQFLPESFSIRETTMMTISAQIATLPLIIYYFKIFSVVSIFANVLILPLIPFSMLFGFLSVFLGRAFAFAAQFFMELVFVLADFFANLPFAYTKIYFVSFWMTGLYYFVLLNLIYKNSGDPVFTRNDFFSL